MLYLAAHCEGEKHDPVNDEHGPKDCKQHRSTFELTTASAGKKRFFSGGRRQIFVGNRSLPGMSKTSNQVHTKPTVIARVALCQNLNSGSLRMNGRNSSSCLVGRLAGPPSSSSSCSSDGSNFGVKNARKRFRRYIPRVYATD